MTATPVNRSTRSVRLGWALALLGCICVAQPATAGAAWSAPGYISDTGAVRHQSAIDSEGDAVFVWEEYDGAIENWRIKVQTRSAAGVLGTAQWVSAEGQGATYPDVAVDANGNALIVWTAAGQVKARSLSAGGALGSTIQTLSGPSATVHDPQVVLDPDGDAVVAWTKGGFYPEGDVVVQAIGRSSGGTLTTRRNLSVIKQDGAADQAADPSLSIDDTGNAMVVWKRNSTAVPARPWYLEARTFSAAGVLGGRFRVATGGTTEPAALELPRVDVDVDGDAVFTWLKKDGGVYGAQTRGRFGGTLGPIQKLSSSAEASDPSAAVDSDGDAVFSWLREGSPRRLMTRSRASGAGGALGVAKAVSPIGHTVFSGTGHVGVDADGNAIFLWQRFASSADGAYGRTLSSTGVFGPVRVVAPSSFGPGDPELAVNQSGDAAASWISQSFSNKLAASFGP